MPLCKVCHRPVQMMCQTGTGFCSQTCEDSVYADSVWARNHAALLDEYNKGLVVR